MGQSKKKALQAVKQVLGMALGPPPDSEVNEIEVQGEDRDKIRLQDQALVQAKLSLADLEMEISRLQGQRFQMIQAIRTNQERWFGLVREACVKRGINPDDESYSGKWHFNQQTWKISRVSPPPPRQPKGKAA